MRRTFADPGVPTRQETIDRETLRAPYRSWCIHCARGRGRNNPHVAGASRLWEATVAMVVGFYKVLKSKEPGSDEQMGPVLVMKDCKCGSMMLMAVPCEGTEHPWVARRRPSWANSFGFNKLGLRMDSEPAIESLVVEIKRVHGDAAETIIERPEKGELQSNGVVESVVRIAEGIALTLKLALEDRVGSQLGPAENAIERLVEHAGLLYARCRVGCDGETAYERLRTRTRKKPM
jgi:hypothetical protein